MTITKEEARDCFPEDEDPRAGIHDGDLREDFPDAEGEEEFNGHATNGTRTNGSGGAYNEAKPKPEPLTFCDIGQWAQHEPPPREWSVLDRFPLRNVSLISGEGSVGKSILLTQLGAAHCLGRDWLETLPEPGDFLYLNAEDEADEIHRRCAAIASHYNASLADLQGHLHILALAGQDAVLGYPDRNGLIKPTPLFDRLKQAACNIKPKLIGLDTSADIFSGNEIDRTQVRQFIGLLRSMAIAANAAVIVATHPSLTGITTGSGLSGSTAWHNSVRARAYMRAVKTDDGTEPDKDLRQIEFMKSNYGRVADAVTLRWKAGAFILEPKAGSLEKLAADAKVEDLFLKLLDRFNGQGRNVSEKTGTAYAPAIFAGESEAKAAKVSKAALTDAMGRLFTANRIHLEPYGFPSRGTFKLVSGPKP
jgi:RecA-family ATPase